jgi:hypothetical protein
MLIWQECVIDAGHSPEFPLDLLRPGNEIPPVYYWDHLSRTRQESTDKDYVMVPTAEMTDSEIEIAKSLMSDEIIPNKYTQAAKVVRGDEVGFVIFG